MRAASCILLIALCLTGCSTFGKKHAKSQDGPDKVADRSGAGPQRGGELPPSDHPVAPPANMNGVLAGMVLNNATDRPPTTYVQVVEAPEPGVRPGAPIEVAADNQGYFTIQGLQAGRRYQLIARARDGNRVLTGTAWATPPDARVLIRVSASYAAPAQPGQPAWPPQNPAEPPPPSWSDPAPSGGGMGASVPRRAADLGPPVGVQNSPNPPGQGYGAPYQEPVTPATVIARPENFADNRPAMARLDPKVQVRPQAGPAVLPGGPARVPSCVLTGNTLYNFALNDLGGQPWEFRSHRTQLTLVDFWGTWCVHCLHAVPHLNILQDRYGRFGLQVVGIAYEGGSPQEQVQKVNRVRQRLQMNYQVLLGSDRDQCPVRRQFGVYNYPTLVLLDQTGRIIWRAEGLDQQHLRELEVIIQQQLRVR